MAGYTIGLQEVPTKVISFLDIPNRIHGRFVDVSYIDCIKKTNDIHLGINVCHSMDPYEICSIFFTVHQGNP